MSETNAPLAERMRPTSLDNYVGQEHLVGTGTPLRLVLDSGMVPSLILWGPPGVGKTTLARILATHAKRNFYQLSAINSGVKDIREIIEKSGKNDLFKGKSPIVFIDEIHRFSKSQQDSLLGAVESGVITLIGATTENPSFEVIPALLSRCQVYILKHLELKDLKNLISKSIKEDVVLKAKKITIKEDTALIRLSGGDARKLLNSLEFIVGSANKNEIIITDEFVQSIVQEKMSLYDKNGENHYDIISAFIKSIRGSDPNAAVYWLARMTDGGEDPKFIARRMLILASEDIGNANPTALVIANNCFQSVAVIGYPECELILSQTAIYLACSPKSNASYEAIKRAKSLVRETGSLPVPLNIRNAPTKLMQEIGYGKDYKYSHSYENNFVEQDFLPKEIKGTIFFEPGENSKEKEYKLLLSKLWKNTYPY